MRDEGIHFSNPWGRRLMKVPTTQNSLEVPRTTVVEKNGNPIEISAVDGKRITQVDATLLPVEQQSQQPAD